MSDLPSPLVPSDSGLTLEALADAQDRLRTAFHVTLVMLVILSGSLFVFFLRETSLARRQVAELSQVVAEYQKNAVPVMEEFRTKLQAYTKTHPDFGPIFNRYFGTNSLTGGPNRAQPLGGVPSARMPPGQ